MSQPHKHTALASSDPDVGPSRDSSVSLTTYSTYEEDVEGYRSPSAHDRVRSHSRSSDRGESHLPPNDHGGFPLDTHDGQVTERPNLSSPAPLRPVPVSTSPDSTPSGQADRTRYEALDPKSATHGRPRCPPTWLSWWPEILCSAAATLLLLGIVALLAAYDGHPQPNWPSSITLNALVSVFATIEIFLVSVTLQACLGQIKWMRHEEEHSLHDFHAVDRAGKSQWGALQLLSKPRIGVPALLGAIASLLTLAVGPFLQQIIQTQSVAVHTGTATLPIAMNLASFPKTLTGGAQVPLAIRLAIFEGLFTGARQSYPVETSCSARSNCTWDTPYVTLGICSTCIDVTSQLIDLPNDPEFGDSGSALPDGGPSLKTQVDTFDGQAQADLAAATPGKTALMSTTMVGRNPADKIQVRAMSCDIDMCLRTLTAHQTDGDFTEEQQGPSRPLVKPDGYWSEETPQGNMTALDSSLDDLSNYLIQFFKVSTNDVPTYIAGPTQGTSGSGPATDSSAAIQAAMFDDSFTVGGLMDNFADSLTRAMRLSTLGQDTTFPASAKVQGSSTMMETHVLVQWPWIALPALLQLFAIVYLCWTIFVTRRGGWQPWKDDLLALLFHGLDTASRQDIGPLNTLEEMNERAKGLRVSLRYEDNVDGRLVVGGDDKAG